MKIRVQSKHVLTEKLLEILWHRSSGDDLGSKRNHLPGRSFGEWIKNPQSDLGDFENGFFWMNWHNTNRFPMPVLNFPTSGFPIDLRFVILEKEDDKIIFKRTVPKERELSPDMLEKIRHVKEQTPERVAEVATKAAEERLQDIQTQLQDIKQRRIKTPKAQFN